MHPAPSLILFSTLSGLGFGFMAWLGVGLPAPAGWGAFWAYALAFVLAGGGLVSSVFHLGHPERALKAFTQWRSSWLSREAWLASAALLVNGAVALGALFGVRLAALGWVGAALALVTVAATSMIYAQLRTVPRWNAWTTPAVFLALSVTGGALLAGQRWAGLLLLLVSAGLVAYAWFRGDGRFAARGTDIATATGLTGGRVRPFEPPHTGENYLTREMVFTVARRHAVKLRGIALVLGFAVPALLLLLGGGWVLVALAAILHGAGVAVQRWLFFAEAEHVVGLYYGRR